jgi:hypothetical protein
MSFNDHIYPELTGFRIRGKTAPPPTFPDTCPACGAKATGYWGGPPGPPKWAQAYECGGKYAEKGQIQSHTNVFWGSCPERTPVPLFEKNDPFRI